MKTSTEVQLDNARIVDVVTGSTRAGNVRISCGSIVDVDAAAAPSHVEVIDLRGGYLLPGLINCHTHLQGQYPYSLRQADEHPGRTALRAAWRARRLLSAGITTVRSVHEQARVDIVVREAAKSGWTRAPRILAGGRGLTVPGGHAAGLGSAIAAGPEAFRSAAREEFAAGADHVKVFLTGGLANPGEEIGRPALTLAELSAVVQAAQERDSYVVAHAGGPDAIQLGLRAGVRSFEHGYHLDDETVTAMAEAGAFLTPTLTVTNSPDWQRRMGFDEAAIARGEAAREEHMASARRAIRAGVTIVAGTDFPGEERAADVPLIVRELQLLVEAGLPAAAAIRAATTTAATLLGLADQIGQVTAGFRADLIAVAEDPTESARACADVRLVMQAGELVSSTR